MCQEYYRYHSLSLPPERCYVLIILTFQAKKLRLNRLNNYIKLVTDLGPKFTRWVCESFKALCSFFPYHTGLPDQVESANDPEKGILAG